MVSVGLYVKGFIFFKEKGSGMLGRFLLGEREGG